MRRGRRARCSRCPDGGGAFLEFLLVIPVLFLFLYAILDFGQYLSELARINQTIFEVARRGSELAHYSALDGTKEFAGFLLPLHERFIDVSAVDIASDVQASFDMQGTATDVSDDVLKVSVDLPLSIGFGKYFTHVNIDYSAHYLKRSVGGFVGQPKNPTLIFGCDESPTTCTEENVRDGDDVDGFDCAEVQVPCP